MGLFMRLVPSRCFRKGHLLSYLNHLPALSCIGISLFRLYRIKILEPKTNSWGRIPEGGVSMYPALSVQIPLNPICSFWAIKQDPYFPSDCII